jgi:hypothetical protein
MKLVTCDLWRHGANCRARALLSGEGEGTP